MFLCRQLVLFKALYPFHMRGKSRKGRHRRLLDVLLSRPQSAIPPSAAPKNSPFPLKKPLAKTQPQFQGLSGNTEILFVIYVVLYKHCLITQTPTIKHKWFIKAVYKAQGEETNAKNLIKRQWKMWVWAQAVHRFSCSTGNTNTIDCSDWIRHSPAPFHSQWKKYIRGNSQ